VATTRTEDGHRLPKQALQYEPKDEGTWDDRERDGGTNFILRIKETFMNTMMMIMMISFLLILTL